MVFEAVSFLEVSLPACELRREHGIVLEGRRLQWREAVELESRLKLGKQVIAVALGETAKVARAPRSLKLLFGKFSFHRGSRQGVEGHEPERSGRTKAAVNEGDAPLEGR